MKIDLCLKRFSEKIVRKNYKLLDNNDIKHFKSILNPDSILIEDLESYNTDWIKKYHGKSHLVLKPKSKKEISQILKYCNDQNLAVVPQSGNTGLVGGSVPIHDEIILNLSKFNKILDFNQEDKSVKCESGCVLQSLNDYLSKFNRVMPIDLAAKGSCQIGGNLATHAGGINFVKYGSLRKNCKSLEVVLANGNLLKLHQEDLLKSILIGSEGTLAVIVESEIFTYRQRDDDAFCIIGLDSFQEVIDVSSKVKEKFQNKIVAIEFFDNQSMIVTSQNFNLPLLFEENNQIPNFFLLIQTENEDNFSYNLYKYQTDIQISALYLLADFLVQNKLDEKCIITDEKSKIQKLWLYREGIASACSKRGIVLKYDISLNLRNFYEIVEIIRNRVNSVVKNYNNVFTIGYGHLGDYNLHINVCYDKFQMDEEYKIIENTIEPYIFDYLKTISGSISAEHGIGQAKAVYLNRSQSDENIQLMKKIKQVFDPKGILNPYKLLQ
jgi:FAD/FMN-containing dehydrogenase